MTQSSDSDSAKTKATVNLPPPIVKVAPSAKPSSAQVPPIVSFSVTNPLTYLKLWWKKLIGNDGVKLTLQIKPLTAVFLVAVFAGVGFSFGRLSLPPYIATYLPLATPSPTPASTPNPWRETAFSGKLQNSGDKYFLTTSSSEAITLKVPAFINLKPLVGKRIFAVGLYNPQTKTMEVSDTQSLEVLSPTPIPIPTITPSPSPESTEKIILESNIGI